MDGKFYIGSTANLTVRFYKYYNIEYLLKTKTHIANAILKYGYSNFKLEILEFCNKSDLIKREQFFIDYLNPAYNILKKAGSSIGFKHNIETINYFKNIRKATEKTKKNLSIAATNRELTQQDKNKISEYNKGKQLSKEVKDKISKTRTELYGINIYVKNTKTNLITEFPSITAAASKLEVSRTAIRKSIKSSKLLKNLYYISIKN